MNSRWNPVVKQITPHGIKIPTSSRTPDRPTIGASGSDDTVVSKWRAITANWNVTVPGFAYYVWSAKHILPALQEKLGDEWPVVVSEMMGDNPYYAYAMQSIGGYIAHNASSVGSRVFSEIGKVAGAAMLKEFEESRVACDK